MTTAGTTNNLVIVEYPAVHKHLQVAAALLAVISLVALGIIFSITNPFGSLQHLILFSIPGSLIVLSFVSLIVSHFLKPSEIEAQNEEETANPPPQQVLSPPSQNTASAPLNSNQASETVTTNPGETTSTVKPLSVINIEPIPQPVNNTPAQKTFQDLMENLCKPVIDQGKVFLTAFIASHAKATKNNAVDSEKIEGINTLFTSLWAFLNKLMNNESFVLKNMIFSLSHVTSKNKLFRRWNYAISFNDEKAKREILAKNTARTELITLFDSVKEGGLFGGVNVKELTPDEWVGFIKKYLAFLEKQIPLYTADAKIDGLKKELLQYLSTNLTAQLLFPKGKVDSDWTKSIGKILDLLNGKEKDLSREIFNFTDLLYDRVQSSETHKPTFTRIFQELMSYMVEKSDDSVTLTKFMKEQIGFLKREVDVNIRSLVAYFQKTDEASHPIKKEDQVDAVHKLNLTWENLTPENDLENNAIYSEMLSLQLRINRQRHEDEKIAVVALSDDELNDATLFAFAFPHLSVEDSKKKFNDLQSVLSKEKATTTLNTKLMNKKIYIVPCKEGEFPMLLLKGLENTKKASAVSPFLGLAPQVISFLRKFIYIPLELPGLNKEGNQEFYKLLMKLISLVSKSGYDLMLSGDNPFKTVFFTTLANYGPIIQQNMDEIVAKQTIQSDEIKDRMVNVIENISKDLNK